MMCCTTLLAEWLRRKRCPVACDSDSVGAITSIPAITNARNVPSLLCHFYEARCVVRDVTILCVVIFGDFISGSVECSIKNNNVGILIMPCNTFVQVRAPYALCIFRVLSDNLN